MKLDKSLLFTAGKSILVLLFCYTAISKIFTFDSFVFQLEKSPLIPKDYGYLFGFGVIGVELITSYILFSKKEKIGLYCSLFLMVSFTTYLYTIINFSYYIPCSCGGVLEKLDWNTHIIFNLAFVALTIILIFLHDKLNNAIPSK